MLALLALSAAAPNLHVAAYKDDVNVIKDQLALGVDVNLKSEEGDRALHVAVAKGSGRCWRRAPRCDCASCTSA